MMKIMKKLFVTILLVAGVFGGAVEAATVRNKCGRDITLRPKYGASYKISNNKEKGIIGTTYKISATGVQDYEITLSDAYVYEVYIGNTGNCFEVLF